MTNKIFNEIERRLVLAYGARPSDDTRNAVALTVEVRRLRAALKASRKKLKNGR